MKNATKQNASAEIDETWLNEYAFLRSVERVERALDGRFTEDERSRRFILDRLTELERTTRPSAGPTAAVGKDQAAFRAISLAASLMQDLAGWAVDHQRGLAIMGLDALVSIPTEPTPDLVARRQRNDQHIHEKRGHMVQDITPTQARQLALNLLRPMSQQFNFLVGLVVALEALQFGETLPILKAVKTRKSGMTENRAKLMALCYMEYQKRKGINKSVTVQEVAAAFAANPETITRNWGKQVRSSLGRDSVNREIKMAEAAAADYLGEPADSNRRPHFEEEYGRPALLRAAETYKRR